MKSKNHVSSSHADRTLRRESAAARASQRAERSTEEQIALLDQRPGASTRERTRLAGPGNGKPHTRPSRQKRAKQRSAA